MPTDFEAEGLLAGLEDGAAREARRTLLAQLEADGVPLEELRRAVEEGRLALVPVERVLAAGASYTRDEVAERAGVAPDLVDTLRRALGFALPAPDDAAYDERTVDMFTGVKRFLEAGMPLTGIVEAARVVSRSAAAIVDAENRVVADSLRDGATELDVAAGWAGATRELRPLMNSLLGDLVDLHRLEFARHEVLGAPGIAGGAATRWTAVCFTDIVGFTRLGEIVPPDELGAVAGRLEEMAGEVATAPVALVKLIGDAAMLAAPDADALLDAALTLVEAAEAEGDDFPPLRAGIAAGEALRRAADWYGRPVNLASRLTGIARAGSVLASEEVKDAAEGDYSWSYAGRRRLKGIRGEVATFRVRRPR